MSSGPHLGFMLIPVVARFDDFRLDSVQDVSESSQGILFGNMGFIKFELFS